MTMVEGGWKVGHITCFIRLHMYNTYVACVCVCLRMSVCVLNSFK